MLQKCLAPYLHAVRLR